MDSFHINFELKPIEKIIPWGENPDLSMHWFGLTDGLLWIRAGIETIYEYSDAARKYFGDNIIYNDYQLARFLEDFSGILPYVREPVPKLLYDKTGEFEKQTDAWKELHYEDEDAVFDKFYDDEFEPLTRWYYNRMLDSGHLVGGPWIGCFRHGDRIKLYWKSDYRLENGSSIWTAPNGIFEMPYAGFVTAVNEFYSAFSEKMDRQVELALHKDWDSIKLDKERLVKENGERKSEFRQKLSLLSEPCQTTDWDKILKIYDKCISSQTGGKNNV